MAALLWYLFALYSIALVFRLTWLAVADYPRSVKFSRAEDVATLAWMLFTYGWLIWVLFREGGAR